MKNKISICIPTNKQNVRKQIEDIKNTISHKDAEIITSCQSGTSAFNRNYCLDRAKGEIIIMLDDDITGFFPGWDAVLIKPLEDSSVSIASARLIYPDGKPMPMMYNNFRYESGYYPPRQNIVPTGCVVFRKTGVRFDEKYTKYGYADTDFCKQVELALPEKRAVINNDCKLTHPYFVSKMGSLQERINRRYYHSKWGMVRKPKKPLTTIIYYTGNTEKESFENKVRENILRVKGNQPIISVSQKPIEFGKNICVGNVGKSYLNAFRQCLMGCEAATTPYVILTESDCLYPKKGYFDFLPTDSNTIYTYDNVWLMWDRQNRTRFYKHGTTCGSIILGRKFYIRMLKEGLKDKPTWGNIKAGPDFFNPELKWESFTGDPMINIKTRQGVSFGTTLTHGVRPKKNFSYWGNVETIKKNYLQ